MQRQMDASIAAHADQETLYDQPQIAKNKLRITGPFSVEAVPFPSVKALDEARQPEEADAGIARSGESARQHTWLDELLKTGIRGKGGQMLKFADLETLPGTTYLHAVGNLDSGERVVVSFGPEHAALEQRQVEMALREAEMIRRARLRESHSGFLEHGEQPWQGQRESVDRGRCDFGATPRRFTRGADTRAACGSPTATGVYRQ